MKIKFENFMQWILPLMLIGNGAFWNKDFLVYTGFLVFFLVACFDKITNPFKNEPKEFIPVIKDYPSE